MQKYKIDLVESLRPLSSQEYGDLSESCQEHGILDPIKVWGEYLIDGRHRIKIADKYKLNYKVEEMEFGDIDEAKAWVYRNQVGKRNLTEIEIQRARAELAKMTSVEDAAEEYGVTTRTIQRDVEATDAMDLMADDVRERCERGEIINSRADWKRYSDLTDNERHAVDQKLRDHPDITMRDALPEKKVGLSAEDLEALNSIPAFDHNLRRRFASGSLLADHASVKKAVALQPDRQELLAVILTDPEVDSLKKALHVLAGTSEPRTKGEAIKIAMSSIMPLVERIQERLKDLMALEIQLGQSQAILDQFVSSLSKIKE